MKPRHRHATESLVYLADEAGEREPVFCPGCGEQAAFHEDVRCPDCGAALDAVLLTEAHADDALGGLGRYHWPGQLDPEVRRGWIECRARGERVPVFVHRAGSTCAAAVDDEVLGKLRQ